MLFGLPLNPKLFFPSLLLSGSPPAVPIVRPIAIIKDRRSTFFFLRVPSALPRHTPPSSSSIFFSAELPLLRSVDTPDFPFSTFVGCLPLLRQLAQFLGFHLSFLPISLPSLNGQRTPLPHFFFLLFDTRCRKFTRTGRCARGVTGPKGLVVEGVAAWSPVNDEKPLFP